MVAMVAPGFVFGYMIASVSRICSYLIMSDMMCSSYVSCCTTDMKKSTTQNTSPKFSVSSVPPWFDFTRYSFLSACAVIRRVKRNAGYNPATSAAITATAKACANSPGTQ